MTKDKIDELIKDCFEGSKLLDELFEASPNNSVIYKAALALQSQQADLDVAMEILKDLGKISVPVELYRLAPVAKRAENFIKKVEKRDE